MLRALVIAQRVAQPGIDGVRQILQQMAGAVPDPGPEIGQPLVEHAVGIGGGEIEIGPEHRTLGLGVDNARDRCRRLDLGARQGRAEALDHQFADDAERVGRPVEIRDGDGVAIGVVHPAQPRLRSDRERGIDDAQVEAVARPQHQPVRPELHGRGIAVGRGVADAQIHRSSQPKAPIRSPRKNKPPGGGF